MSQLTLDTRYLTEIQFQSERGEALSVVFGEDRAQACIMMHGNIPLHKDSTPQKLVSAARRKGNEGVAVYSPADALKFVTARFAYFDSEITEAELKKLCGELVGDATHKGDKTDIKAVFALIEKGEYVKALKAWWSLDTFVREGFPERLTSWLRAKAAA